MVYIPFGSKLWCERMIWENTSKSTAHFRLLITNKWWWNNSWRGQFGQEKFHFWTSVTTGKCLGVGHLVQHPHIHEMWVTWYSTLTYMRCGHLVQHPHIHEMWVTWYSTLTYMRCGSLGTAPSHTWDVGHLVQHPHIHEMWVTWYSTLTYMRCVTKCLGVGHLVQYPHIHEMWVTWYSTLTYMRCGSLGTAPSHTWDVGHLVQHPHIHEMCH